MKKGWTGERYRHGTARRGIKTVQTCSRGNKKYPELDVSYHYWSIKINPDGTMKLTLGNWTDAGWFWDGDETQVAGFLMRMATSQKDVREQFLKEMKENNVDYNLFKKHMLDNIDDNESNGIYELTGDNSRWRFGESFDIDIEYEIESFEEENNIELTESEKIKLQNMYWLNNFNNCNINEFEKSEIYKDIKKDLKHFIEGTTDFDDFFDYYEPELKNQIIDKMLEWDDENNYNVLSDTIPKWKKWLKENRK